MFFQIFSFDFFFYKKTRRQYRQILGAEILKYVPIMQRLNHKQLCHNIGGINR